MEPATDTESPVTDQTADPGITILIGYHKPDFIIQNKILTPIHLGRAITDGVKSDSGFSEAEQKTLLAMPGDDTGDNISSLNRKFSELTGIYWAWKNYEQLGNPEYFGMLHYRRLLDFSCTLTARTRLESHDALRPEWFSEKSIQDVVPRYDICIQALYNILYWKRGTECLALATVKDHYAGVHNGNDLELAFSVAADMYPEYTPFLKAYLASTEHYLCNMFVMRKQLFFYYAKWIFSILFKVGNKINYSGYTSYQYRAISFLDERLTGAFMLYMDDRQGVAIKRLHSISINC